MKIIRRTWLCLIMIIEVIVRGILFIPIIIVLTLIRVCIIPYEAFKAKKTMGDEKFAMYSRKDVNLFLDDIWQLTNIILN
jgi:hypothetical protein